MAKHNKVEAVEEQTNAQVEVEQPKEKVGDKVEAKTQVDGAEKKERAPRTPKNVKYRILDGVDASKFAGQRGHVIRALQGLSSKHGADAFHSAEEVAAATEGLVSRTPVLDSVNYHLKGMVKEGQVVSFVPETKADEKKEEAAA